jgi:hypothetical protein
MSLSNCKLMRAIVVTAGILFVLGIVLQLPRLVLADNFVLFTTLLSGMGLSAMVLSPVLMLVNGALALFPGISRSLHLCQH